MKKMKRIVALSVALILVCFSATGCNAIDEMRNNQAFYTETGGVKLRGTDYLPLPENEYFRPFKRDDSAVIRITEPDVPVLLSAEFGDYSTLYNDGEILYSNYMDVYYCRVDKYPEYNAVLSAPFEPTGYCYTYRVLNTDTLEYIEHIYQLTAEQVKAVDEIRATVTPTVQDENADYTYDYFVALDACDDTMLLRDEAVSIAISGNEYTIVRPNYNGEREDLQYTVPPEYSAMFDSIVKQGFDAVKASDKYFNELYDYDEDEYDIDYEVV